MRLRSLHEAIEQFKLYRKNMGTVLDRAQALKIWGEEQVTKYEDTQGEIIPDKLKNPVRDEKIRIARDICEDLYIKPFVKLIGVSGSVAAGIMKDDDDIDLFIVVQDHCSWLYRGFAKLRLGSRVIWFGDKDKKNNICLNYISEERGLLLDNQDIFNMHEIYYLEPIYGKEYYPEILKKNPWLRESFHADIPNEEAKKCDRSFLQILLFIPNLIAFLSQVLYMLLLRHDPEVSRLFRSYRKGRIEFYRSDFRTEKLEDFYNKKDGN